MPGGELGSVQNPIKADQPDGERSYLKRLRTADGKRVVYKYRGAVPGTDGRILDRFELEPHPYYENCPLDGLQKIADIFLEEGECPYSLMIYMDMYHPGYTEKTPLMSYKLLLEP